MSTQSQIVATREELDSVRRRMSDTVTEIESLVEERVDTVKARLDAMQVVREHPWHALAVAAGIGAALAASGADQRAARAAAEATRSAAKSGAASLKSASSRAALVTADTARHAPSRARGAIVGALDSLAAKLALSLIERLREPAPLTATPEPAGLGYVEETTLATGVDSLAG
jgi:hypothetical protein